MANWKSIQKTLSCHKLWAEQCNYVNFNLLRIVQDLFSVLVSIPLFVPSRMKRRIFLAIKLHALIDILRHGRRERERKRWWKRHRKNGNCLEFMIRFSLKIIQYDMYVEACMVCIIKTFVEFHKMTREIRINTWNEENDVLSVYSVRMIQYEWSFSDRKDYQEKYLLVEISIFEHSIHVHWATREHSHSLHSHLQKRTRKKVFNFKRDRNKFYSFKKSSLLFLFFWVWKLWNFNLNFVNSF